MKKRKFKRIKQNIKYIKEDIKEKWECPNNNLFLLALISIIIFLFSELITRIYDLYRNAPNIDIISHLFGGIAIAITIYWIVSMTQVKHKKFTVGFLTLILAGLWEIFETLGELIIPDPPHLRDIFFWDGFWDIIITTIGAIIAIYIINYLRKNTILLRKINL